jgi:cbb3-type cytochrome oxidase maturation protein
MESLYFLIPLSIVVITVAVAIFFWAVKSGQYDDIDREGERILFDDDDLDQPVSTKPDKSSAEKQKTDNKEKSPS